MVSKRISTLHMIRKQYRLLSISRPTLRTVRSLLQKPSEVFTTANVTNSDGELEYGEQPTSDEIQDMLAIQNFWANPRRGTRLSR